MAFGRDRLLAGRDPCVSLFVHDCGRFGGVKQWLWVGERRWPRMLRTQTTVLDKGPLDKLIESAYRIQLLAEKVQA